MKNIATYRRILITLIADGSDICASDSFIGVPMVTFEPVVLYISLWVAILNKISTHTSVFLMSIRSWKAQILSAVLGTFICILVMFDEQIKIARVFDELLNKHPWKCQRGLAFVVWSKEWRDVCHGFDACIYGYLKTSSPWHLHACIACQSIYDSCPIDLSLFRMKSEVPNRDRGASFKSGGARIAREHSLCGI